MKRLFSLFLALLCTLCVLTGCKKPEKTRIYTLNGTTGFGMAPLIAAGDAAYTFTVEKDATAVRTALLAGDCDIAALPTNLAALLYNATEGGVRVIALNTGSVLYLVTTGESAVSDLSHLAGKTVYTPAQNPAFIFEALLAAAEITDVTVDSTTYATPEALRTAVAAGLVTHAVLPEPMVTLAAAAGAENGVTVTRALALGTLWQTYFQDSLLVQGCVVVRTAYLEAHPDRVAAFLADYQNAIKKVNDDPTSAAADIADANIFANKSVAAAAIPRCDILYLDGNDMKAALAGFLAAMPKAAIGGKLPLDDFYHIPS